MTSSATDILKEPLARDHVALPGFTEEVVNLSDHSTLVRDSHGSGVPIVLVHAMPMDSRVWSDGIFRRLSTTSRNTRRVLAYDLRGHGHARGAPLIKSVAHLVSDLLELLDELGLPKIDLYGVSFGGAVAQAFAIAHPQRLRSAAFIATTARGNEIMAERAKLAETSGMKSLVNPTVERMFLPETIAEEGWIVQYARERVETASVQEFAAAWRAMANFNCEERLGEIEIPVLVLAGRQDTSTPPAVMKLIAGECKYAEYRELERGMHLFVMENAEAAAEELIAFRARIDVVPV